MERQMSLNEDILRFLTLRVNELNDEPSIQAQIKSNQSDDSQENGEFKARTPEEIVDTKPTGKNVTKNHGDVNSASKPDVTVETKEDDNAESKDSKNEHN